MAPQHASDAAAVVAGFALAAAAPLGSTLRKWSAGHRHATESFQAGVSLAYVVLDLLVELTSRGSDAVHTVLPFGPAPLESLFAVLLVGATGWYLVGAAATRVGGQRAKTHAAFLPRAIYGVFVGGALTLEAEHGTRSLVLFAVPMLLHLGVVHAHIAEEADATRGWAGRVPLAFTPAAGALVWAGLGVPQTVLFVSLALVAGSTIVQVFQNELPSPAAVRVAPFLIGMGVYAALIGARWGG